MLDDSCFPSLSSRTILHRPEEAIDGVGDNMPMFSMSHHGPMGDSTQSPPHNLVTISEPLLDLRNYSQMSCGLVGSGLGSSCSGGHESADLRETAI